MPSRTIYHYDQHAAAYQRLYDSLDSAIVHRDWLSILQQLKPAWALDVGAGSGRDALWLTQLGWRVVAAEPASGLRRAGRRKTGAAVQWIDGHLPHLNGLTRPEGGFQLILLSAVWMHLPALQRPLALSRLASQLASHGVIIISLRFGPSDPNRPMYSMCVEELDQLASAHHLALQVLSPTPSRDALKRPDVVWKTVCLRHLHTSTMG